nr:transposase [Cryobacterium sp. Y50]
MFQGASWQRCRVHQTRNILSIVRFASPEMVASVIRTICAQLNEKRVKA